MATGKQVLLYLVDGSAGGLRTAEIANWTGHVVAGPRKDLARLLGREEASRTGVYLLLGDDPDQPGGALAYIGETDEVAARLRHHQSKKEWWDRFVVITSQALALQLTKSQVRYVEAALIARARETGRARLDNGTEPTFSRLSEAETSNMDAFLEELHVLLPAIGVDLFRGRSTFSKPSAAPTESSTSPIFEMRSPRNRIEARARLVDGEFFVLEGSTAAATVLESDAYSAATTAQYAGIAAKRAELMEQGFIETDGDRARFAKDTPFGSPSAAGSQVMGRSCNGRKKWVSEAGETFGAWEGRGGAVGTDGVA